jgi:hypothetical protein
MKELLIKLQQKFNHIEQKDDMIVISTFYKNGNKKNWWSVYKVENDNFRLTRGNIQITDGNLDYIVGICLNYID